MKTLKLSNHISPQGKTIQAALKSKFGFSLEELNSALMGDTAQLQKIGEAARQGKITAEVMPLLSEAYSNIINGTTAYNTGIAKLLKQGASSAIAIDKAVAQTALANQKYVHQRKEIKTDYALQRQAETKRHEYALDFVQLKAYIDTHLAGVDRQAQTLQQNNRPQLKQVEENQRYELAATKELLTKGNSARLDLLPQKDYTHSWQPKDFGMMRKIQNLRNALGF